MAAKRKTAAAAAAPSYVDYVVRFTRPGAYSRSQVFRALDEQAAATAALAAVTSGNWQGWTIMDVSTVEEAKARLGVSNG